MRAKMQFLHSSESMDDMMKKIIMVMLMFCLVSFITMSGAMAFSGSAYVKWLIHTFGVLDTGEHPLVSRVRNVFEKVRTTADKRMNRLPKLLILKEAGDPWAMCWKNGAIILTQKSMEFCYQNVDKSIGDARIAFVLGHELAHLANDDFWDLEVSQAIQRFADSVQGDKSIRGDSENFQQIHAMLAISPDDMRARQKRELKADSYALLYAAMAGYSPKAIVDTQGKNFFQEWSNLTTGKIAYAQVTHPGAEQRAIFLLSEMEKVKTDLILFEIGVRLCQLGMYKDALDFFKTFQRKFPCREVFNNIGLIHYQIAMNALASIKPSDQNKAYRYKLSTILDMETRASTFRGTDDMVKEEFWNAKRNFIYACDLDRFYIPARINLSSVLIMNGEYAEAIRILDQALGLDKDDPHVLNNLAVAKYLFGMKFKVATSHEAVHILKELTEKHPGYAKPFFNLKCILSEQKKDALISTSLNPPLTLLNPPSDPLNPPSTSLRDHRDLNQESSSHLKFFNISPPISLNKRDESAQNFLAKVPKQSFDLENITGDFYMGKSFQVLVLEDEIIFVKSLLKESIPLADLVSRYGNPIWISKYLDGTDTFVYEKFAIDVKNEAAVHVIYF